MKKDVIREDTEKVEGGFGSTGSVPAGSSGSKVGIYVAIGFGVILVTMLVLHFGFKVI